MGQAAIKRKIPALESWQGFYSFVALFRLYAEKSYG
jgi:hypothetical protein